MKFGPLIVQDFRPRNLALELQSAYPY